MFRKFVLILFFLFTNSVFAQYPDGTLIFSSKNGPVGRIAKRITGGDQYTHIAIVIDNIVYESDWPRAKATHVSRYGKPRTTNDYYIPNNAYSTKEVKAMLNNAKANLGKPYRLKNYIYPNSRPTNGTWCSPYTSNVLESSGRYMFTQHDRYEPQNLFTKIRNDYSFLLREKK